MAEKYTLLSVKKILVVKALPATKPYTGWATKNGTQSSVSGFFVV